MPGNKSRAKKNSSRNIGMGCADSCESAHKHGANIGFECSMSCDSVHIGNNFPTDYNGVEQPKLVDDWSLLKIRWDGYLGMGGGEWKLKCNNGMWQKKNLKKGDSHPFVGNGKWACVTKPSSPTSAPAPSDDTSSDADSTDTPKHDSSDSSSIASIALIAGVVVVVGLLVVSPIAYFSLRHKPRFLNQTNLQHQNAKPK